MSISVRRPSYNFRRICVAGCLGRLSYEMARSPLSPLYARHLGASTRMVGLIVAAVTITGIFVKLPAGALADKFGFRPLMASGGLVKASAPFLYLFVSSWPWLLAVRFYHGFATALYAPAAAAFVAKSYPEERGHRLGLYGAAENAGVVLGPILGAMVLGKFGFSTAFCVSGAIGTLSLFAILRLSPDSPDASGHGAPEKRSHSVRQTVVLGIKQIVSDSGIRLISLVEGTLYMGVGTLQAYLPLYAQNVHIAIPAIGLLYGAQGIASIGGRPYFGKLSDKFGRKSFIVGGILLCALSLILIPHSTRFMWLFVLNFLFGLGTGMVTPSTSAMIGDRVKQGNYGSAMGVFGSLWDCGHAAGPILMGVFIAAFGYRNAFLLLSLLIVAALCIFIGGMNENSRRKYA